MYLLTTSPSGRAVKWLRGTFLLKGVDRVRLFGRHSHTQTNALPGTYAAVLTKGNSRTDASHVSRQSLSRVPIAPLYARGPLTSYSCFAQGLLQPPTSAGSPFPLSRAPWQKFSVEVRGFEPVTLLREMYLLTTSPSGRATPPPKASAKARG